MAPVKLGDLLYLDDGDLRDNVTVIAVCPPDRTGRVLGPLRVVNVTRKPNRVDMEFEPFSRKTTTAAPTRCTTAATWRYAWEKMNEPSNVEFVTP
jgi:hypothetical protein